ncbi:ATP-dependent zinc metalloprotease FtsH [bacterium]|nr:ATP-dependent zinc metalloprotease FtsH [bacterium]
MSAMGMMGQGEESIFGIGRSQAKIVRSSVKFSDVAGIEEEKNELIEIVDYLKNPEKYAAMGARTPRGVLLYGPPGTGKTLLAKAVAGEAKVPFFQVSGSGFEDMLVGVGAKRVRDLFNRAKKAAPSIIFIDEIDSVASKRGRADIIGGGGGIADQTINQLLAEMDGFNTKTGVVIMAATNRLEALDEAILRPGRFDRHIQVNLPDIKEREAILKIHARNKNLSTKVELADIARRTPGFSGAQLENVLNEATLLTVRRNKTAITMDEIDEAIDRVIAGPAKHTRIITDKERKQIAYHEAGHALVGLHSKGGDVIEKITIIPRGVAAGYTISTPAKQELSIQRKTDLLAIVRTTLGGRAAEFVEYGPQAISTGAANDLYKVSTIVRSMVTQLGMSEVGMTQLVPSVGMKNSFAQKLYSEDTAVKIDHEVEKIIQQEYQKAIDIVTKNKKELELIVETLLLLETIVKKQIDYIHKKLKLPQEALDKKRSLSSRKKPNRSKDV